MSNERDLGGRKSRRGLVIAVKEKLDGVNVDLTSLFCRHGANVYILTYENNGVRKHTFIDAGDLRYQNRILSVLAENDVEPANIERIIITHGHPDHYGLAYLLAKESKAKVMVQSSFRSLVEGEIGQREQRSLVPKIVINSLKQASFDIKLYETNRFIQALLSGIKLNFLNRNRIMIRIIFFIDNYLINFIPLINKIGATMLIVAQKKSNLPLCAE